MLLANTSLSATELAVPLDDLPTDRIVTGASRAGAAPLAELGGLSCGVWEITPGVSRDIEAEEMFVVLSGQAVVSFDDGTPAMQLVAGSVARLAAGAKTVWDVKETLRKVYILGAP